MTHRQKQKSEFQSTLPQGEWHDLYIQRVVIQFISIHTPARGVTRIRTPTTVSKKYFNPHSRKGSDHKIRNSPCYKVISIHTPARGVTCTYYLNPSNNEFQSTLPQGEWRSDRFYPLMYIEISIHTPARGVTMYSLIKPFPVNISIHTPARGVTAVPP